MGYNNKFLKPYARPGEHGSPKDEETKKKTKRQENNPKLVRSFKQGYKSA